MSSSEKWTFQQCVPKPMSKIISEEILISSDVEKCISQEPDLQQPGVAEPISEGDVEEADSEDKPVEEYKRILKIDSQDLYICTWLGKKSQNSLHLPSTYMLIVTCGKILITALS